MAATLSTVLLAVLGAVTMAYGRFMGLGQIYKGLGR
jgi:hypothetical protein